jgi:hypothetical protein
MAAGSIFSKKEISLFFITVQPARDPPNLCPVGDDRSVLWSKATCATADQSSQSKDKVAIIWSFTSIPLYVVVAKHIFQ